MQKLRLLCSIAAMVHLVMGTVGLVFAIITVWNGWESPPEDDTTKALVIKMAGSCMNFSMGVCLLLGVLTEVKYLLQLFLSMSNIEGFRLLTSLTYAVNDDDWGMLLLSCVQVVALACSYVLATKFLDIPAKETTDNDGIELLRFNKTVV